ncbi:MAG: DotI/IcmL family type IV secretion protein [Gammaproteobacteria bacterium]|nr:DotI/IcmL family type IV secretion protein [Gammaproteobacteria bacterium]
MSKITAYTAFILLTASISVQAAPDDTQLAVWANEAIVATYSYNYKNFLQRQKAIAKYFTAAGWTNYSDVLMASKLPDAVKANSYFVSAVATLPPTIKATSANQWQANMPLLVIYKNPQYQQKQTLEVTINFSQAPSGQGIRGLAITSLIAKISKPACKCNLDDEGSDTTTTAGDEQPQQGAK